MKIISTLRKQTKTGLSVWNFCYEHETDTFFATDGKQVRPASTNAHLYNMYMKFRQYGYRKNLPVKAAKPIKKRPTNAFIADPWSELPEDMQQELFALK